MISQTGVHIGVVLVDGKGSYNPITNIIHLFLNVVKNYIPGYNPNLFVDTLVIVVYPTAFLGTKVLAQRWEISPWINFPTPPCTRVLENTVGDNTFSYCFSFKINLPNYYISSKINLVCPRILCSFDFLELFKNPLLSHRIKKMLSFLIFSYRNE